MEHLLQQFQSHSLPSLLLQYEEYLHITSTANEYYDQQIAAFTELLSRYSLLLDLKAASMKSDSCPE